MTARKALIFGCAGLSGLATASFVLISVWMLHVTEDPKDLWLSAEVPRAVQLDDTFHLVVRVANRGSKRHIELGDLDISDRYLRGFSIQSVSPEPRSTRIDTTNDCTTARFAVILAPGDEAEFQFELRAVRAGRYRGQIDQYVGMQFLSTVVETTVGR